MNDKKTNKKYSEKDEKHLELNEPKVQYYGNETSPESDNLNPASWNPEYNSKKLLNIINGFYNLEHDWDSYGAEPISHTAINTAKKILEVLSKEKYFSQNVETNVFPMRDGGVQFEFDKEFGSAELEINPKGILTLIFFNDTGEVLNHKQLFEVSGLPIFLKEFAYA